MRARLIWTLFTVANISIYSALVYRKAWRNIPAVFWTEAIFMVVNIGWNMEFLLATARQHSMWWFLFDEAGIIETMALFRSLCCVPMRREAKLLPWLYLSLAIAKLYEYALAEDAFRDAANHIYFLRSYVGIFTAFLLAWCVYHRSINTQRNIPGDIPYAR